MGVRCCGALRCDVQLGQSLDARGLACIQGLSGRVGTGVSDGAWIAAGGELSASAPGIVRGAGTLHHAVAVIGERRV